MSLDQIHHIVVLMLENRSFDHMLGYLSLQEGRTDIDGLTGAESNDFDGTRYKPEHLTTTVFEVDPGHAWNDVEQQLANHNGGFVANFATRAEDNLGSVMGYYTRDEVSVFHHLSEHYCVCDRWFSPLPTATQPNRAYSLMGTSEGKKNNDPAIPTFEDRTVFHVLDERSVSWQYYSHDIAFLRAHKDFRLAGDRIDKVSPHFYRLVRSGRLPAVTWIDPDFGANPFDLGKANDDHPPHDVLLGQRLVGRVYNALRNAPNRLFERTLLIVIYDEHGGFYDHVVPGKVADDYSDLKRYGVRVPAFVISPWVEPRSVSHEIFDHTSIIRTILERFCRDESGDIPYMTRRVHHASHLGAVLTGENPVVGPPAPTVVIPEDPVEATALAARPPPLTDFQRRLLDLREECLAQGAEEEEL